MNFPRRFVLRALAAVIVLAAISIGPEGAGWQRPAGYATDETIPSEEVRGVWMHPSLFAGETRQEGLGKIRKTLDDYSRAGLNALFFLVKNTSGHVYFESEVGVRDASWDWDVFGAVLDEARKRNMTVHPWFCVFPESSLLGKVGEHPEWLIEGSNRERVAVANPALPEARAYEISLMIELLRKYPVDWIHLDYIRYPCEPVEPYFSYDATTLELFRNQSGIDLSMLKARDSGNTAWNEWLSWNRDQVTLFVRELHAALKTTGREIKLSAAVFPDPDNAKVLIGQDWAAWAAEGLVDMLCPMLYTNDTALFKKYLQRAAEVKGGGCLLCPGIGIVTSHNRITPDGMSEEVRMARDLRADGFVFFSGGSLKEEFLKKLGEEASSPGR